MSPKRRAKNGRAVHEDMQHESSDDFWHASDDIEYQRLRKKKKEDLADPAKEWSDLDQLRYLSLRAKKQMYRAAQAPAEKMAAPSEGTTKAHGSVGTLEVKMTPPEEVLTAPVEESTATPTKDMPGEADEPSSHTENTVEQPDPVIENQVATDQTPAEAEVAMPALRSSKAQQKKRNREILRRARAEAEKKANMDEEEGTGEANTFIRYEADELRSLGGDTSLEVRYKDAEVGVGAYVEPTYDVSELENGVCAEESRKPDPPAEESLLVHDEPAQAVSMPEPECYDMAVKPKMNKKQRKRLRLEEGKPKEETLLAALSPYADAGSASQFMPCESVLLKHYHGKLTGRRWEAVVMPEDPKAPDSDLENQITNLHLESDQTAAEHAAEVTKLGNQLEMLNKKDYELFQRLRADIKQLEEYRADAQKTVKRLEASLDEVTNRLPRLARELRASKDERRDEVYILEGEVEVLKAQNADGDEEIKGLKLQIEEMVKKSDQDKKSLQSLLKIEAAGTKTLRGEVSTRAKREHQQDVKNKELDAAKKAQGETIAKLKRELVGKKTAQNLEQDLKAAKSHISALQRREIEMKTQMAQHEGSIQGLRLHIEVAKEETDVQKQGLHAQIERLRTDKYAELKDLRAEVQRLGEGNQEYALAAVAKDKVIQESHAANGRAETKIAQDNQRIQGLELEIRALNLMIDERKRAAEEGDDTASSSSEDYEIV